MEQLEKAYELFSLFYENNLAFRKLIDIYKEKGLIRTFNDEEVQKIESQNFMSPTPEMNEFIDMFKLGYNIGNCVGTSMQLSYSYDDIDIVSGTLPILKGTKNSENGGHCWLETDKFIIDTSLMLVIDKSLKNQFGYIEEQRLTSYDLKKSDRYQARKYFATDKNLKNNL